MAATVLADAGYAEINLGPDTPPAAFLHAVEAHHPDLVWLSLTTPLEPSQRHNLVQQLLNPLEAKAVEVVLGGREAVSHRGHWPDGLHVMASMEELATHISS
jgi:methanogenic corrinoid protein MtbC1